MKNKYIRAFSTLGSTFVMFAMVFLLGIVAAGCRYLDRIEVCHGKTCVKFDKDGDGEFELHFTKDDDHEHLDRNP